MNSIFYEINRLIKIVKSDWLVVWLARIVLALLVVSAFQMAVVAVALLVGFLGLA